MTLFSNRSPAPPSSAPPPHRRGFPVPRPHPPQQKQKKQPNLPIQLCRRHRALNLGRPLGSGRFSRYVGRPGNRRLLKCCQRYAKVTPEEPAAAACSAAAPTPSAIYGCGCNSCGCKLSLCRDGEIGAHCSATLGLVGPRDR